MKQWFVIKSVDGDCQCVRCKNWSKLIPYIAEISRDAKYNGASVSKLSWFDGLLCSIMLILGDSHCKVV